MSQDTEKVSVLPRHVEGSMEAPVIYFEGAPNLGINQGVGRITLEMMIFDPTDGTDAPQGHRKIVAHLRGPLSAFADLRAAINQMELLAAPPQGGDQPN